MKRLPATVAVTFTATVFLCTVLLITPAVGEELTAEQREYDPHIQEQIDKTGKYTITIDSIPHVLYAQALDDMAELTNPGAVRELIKREPRLKNKVNKDGKTEFSYRVQVPKDYRRDRPAGLVVYIPPSDHGFIHDSFFPAMMERNLIVIAAYDSGNKLDAAYRAALAIHAVELIKRRYAIDDHRVYISGTSGGGGAATMTMYFYPDIFVGGFPMFGAQTIDTVKHPTKNGSMIAGLDKLPSRDKLKQMARNRYAFVTGETDHNHDSCLAAHNNLLQRGVHSTFIPLPGVGHGLVKGGKDEHMVEPIEFLDAPLIKEALKLFEDGHADLKRERLEAALENFNVASRYLELSKEEATLAKAKTAREQVAVLNQQYEDAVKAVVDAIAAKDERAATQALRDLQRSWRDRLGREAANDYRKQILEIKRGG